MLSWRKGEHPSPMRLISFEEGTALRPQDVSALELAHSVVARHVKPGDLCVDATAGRGNDTAFLCGLVGETGRVLAFDIQPEAVECARALLKAKGYAGIADVLCESHDNMAAHAAQESVSCVMFNLGWLPGGNHSLFTRPETTIPAVEQALALLKPGGLLCLCVYYGRESGYRERDALLAHVAAIDPRRFTVIVSRFENRPNDPPFPVFVWKHAT